MGDVDLCADLAGGKCRAQVHTHSSHLCTQISILMVFSLGEVGGRAGETAVKITRDDIVYVAFLLIPSIQAKYIQSFRPQIVAKP